MNPHPIEQQFRHYLLFCALLCLAIVGCEGADDFSHKYSLDDRTAPQGLSAEEQQEKSARDATKQAGETAGPVFETAFIASAKLAAQSKGSTAPAPTPSASRPTNVRELEQGTIDRRKVQSIFASTQGPMQRCYERALRQNQHLQGRVVLELLIGEDGSVREAKVQRGPITDKIMIQCMESHARTVKFPKPEGGSVRIQLPYVFNPQH